MLCARAACCARTSSSSRRSTSSTPTAIRPSSCWLRADHDRRARRDERRADRGAPPATRRCGRARAGRARPDAAWPRRADATSAAASSSGSKNEATGRPTDDALYTVSIAPRLVSPGPLLVPTAPTASPYDELVEVTGRERRRGGQVLELEGDRMVVQVLGGTRGRHRTPRRSSRARGRAARRRRPDLGRVLDGMGRPADGGAQPVAEVAATSTGCRSIRSRARTPPSSSRPASRRSTGASRSFAARSYRSSPATACRARARGADRRGARARRRTSGFVVVFAAIGVTAPGGGLLPRRASDRRRRSSASSCCSTWPTTRPSERIISPRVR